MIMTLLCLLLHLFQTHAALIMTCVALQAVSPTRDGGFVKELQRKRGIIPMEQIMVSKNHYHHYGFGNLAEKNIAGMTKSKCKHA